MCSSDLQWRNIASQCSGWHGELSQAVDYIESTNENAASETFTSYARGKSNVSGVQALGTNANAIADGFEKAAQAVRGYKTTCIATATTVTALIKAMRKAPGADVEAVKQQIERAGTLLKQADAKTASAIGGN